LVNDLVACETEAGASSAVDRMLQECIVFDLLIIQDQMSKVSDMEAFLRRASQFLRPDGKLVATFPMNYGKEDSLVKDSETGQILIPGWEVLNQALRAGYKHAVIHLVSSWKYGILSSNLPGVLIMEITH
jgi:SAM-dependent methyltransferase